MSAPASPTIAAIPPPGDAAAAAPAARGAVIALERLSKCYRRYHRQTDRIKQLLFRRRQYYREFWALSDVSLEIHRGETVGIVGPNGSGKSTLLQLVCGTVLPTSGRVESRGRIAALLELGAGFHPDFTGRDNVYTNAAILGFSEREIDAKFDEIVAFAGLEDFIDQPVKTYSSGMYVRLAFSVAISVEPDILVIDEALAVGDAAFQAKCYGRLREIQRRGGTILFVSHDPAAVLELCSRAVLLDRGELLLDADPRTVVTRYQKLAFCPPERLDRVRAEIRRSAVAAAPVGRPAPLPSAEARTGAEPRAVADACRGAEPCAAVETLAGAADAIAAADAADEPGQSGTRDGSSDHRAYFETGLRAVGTVDYEPQGAEILDVRLTTLDGRQVNVLVPDEDYLIRYRAKFHEPAYAVLFGSMVKTRRGVELTTMAVPRGRKDYVPAGADVDVTFRFRCLLVPDTYFVNAGVFGMVRGRETFLHRITDAAVFRVVPRGQRATGGMVDLYVDARLEFPPSAREAAA